MTFWAWLDQHRWFAAIFGTVWLFMVCDAAQNVAKVLRRKP